MNDPRAIIAAMRGSEFDVLRFFEPIQNSESERSLSAEDVRTYLAAPVSDVEREDVLALVEWFCRRYPTPLARLEYVRNACARWQQTSGSATG
jgi:hypothetical protein